MNVVSQPKKGAAAVSGEIISSIGFLTESLNSLYQSNIWIGASDAATRLGYSLICYAGGSLSTSSWNQYEQQRNCIYNFIDKNNLDGIVIAGSLGNFISGSQFRDFYHNYIDIPLVCLGPEIPSVPTVIVDNTHGMRELISHLVEHHQCRKIAFVRGPEANQEAQERLRIFKEVLREHNQTPDDHLIIDGDFSRDAGIKAVEYLLKNELDFDALVGANDDTALGALKAFQEHHIRVPEEVLVVGFDDIEESSFSAPPLTTVRQPLYEMGAKSIEVIHDSIEGKKIKGTIIVPASIVTRQSCGCYRHYDAQVKSPDPLKPLSYDELCLALKSEVSPIIDRVLMHVAQPFQNSPTDTIITTLADEIFGFSQEGSFVSYVNKFSWLTANAGGDILGLYNALNVMKQFAVVSLHKCTKEEIETLFNNANVAIADTTSRVQANRRLSSERRASILRSAGQAIASAFDFNQVLDVIASELTNLEIDGCYLSIYKNDTEDGEVPETLQLVLALNEGKRLPLPENNEPFSAPCLVPEGVLNITAPHSLLIEPLYFRDEQIGIIIFDVRRCREGMTYEILQQHISSALKGALLMKKVQKQTAALEVANRQLQKLRDAEHAYLQAIKHELELGRDIQNSFLPDEIPQIEGWELVTFFQPAREVSGDFYDIFRLDDGKLVLVICDVSGKDVSAALYMALIRTLLRALAEQSLAGAVNPLDAISLTNKYLINHHYGTKGRYMYATLCMVVIDLQNNTASYVNAGHNPSALISSDGTIRDWIKTTGPAIGIIPEADFGLGSFTISSEECLFLFTDGITEARNKKGELFSKERLIPLLEKKYTSADDLKNSIEEAVKHYSEGEPPFDDITMLIVKNQKKR